MDHEYLDAEYEPIVAKIKYLVDQIIRDDLRDGVGISVRYYSWTQIRYNKGRHSKCFRSSSYTPCSSVCQFSCFRVFTDFTIVMSISNCKDTWQIFHEVQQETLLLIALTEANCPRLPSAEAVMVTLNQPQSDLKFIRIFF